ncbi:Probable serine/threonine-protein kinase [Galdieria sulphuraria]|nr:Probable serine/threonine-protein kinase [Galdieria sulphuraria]
MFRAVKRALSEAANLYDTCQSVSSSSSNKPVGHSYQGTRLCFGERKVQVGPLIAEGGFSFIYKATDEDSLEKFALKRTLCLDKESFDMAYSEVQVFQLLPPHRNIVRYYGSQTKDLEKGNKEVLILLELCEVIQVFQDACSAVAHLHAQHPTISHRDIKLENLLKSTLDNCFKLCDFGSCCFNSTQITNRKERFEQEYILQKQSTFMYRAPEMVDLYGKQKLTEKVDIWALGCILYILCYRKHPFETGSAVQILNGKVDIPSVPTYSVALRKLILDMLQVNPDKRPSANDIICVLKSLHQTTSSSSFSCSSSSNQSILPLEPIVGSVGEDWAHFGNDEDTRVADEEPTLINLESPVSSKGAEKHIFDLL